MNLNPIKNAIAPYLTLVKVGVLVVIFGAGVWAGFKLDPDTDCGQLDAETAAELATAKAANASYEELEASRAKEASQKEAELKAAIAAEAQIAAHREADLRAQLAHIKAQMRKADANPACAELLRMQVCETITLP